MHSLRNSSSLRTDGHSIYTEFISNIDDLLSDDLVGLELCVVRCFIWPRK
uniref:Uncharacterized protein n=1 Tax=Arundo donax TaxID=35708 RepID=A0A0A9E2R0_ARUDO